MSVCLESSNVLTTQVSNSSVNSTSTITAPTTPTVEDNNSTTTNNNNNNNKNNNIRDDSEQTESSSTSTTTVATATTPTSSTVTAVATTTINNNVLQIPQQAATVRAITKLPVATNSTNLTKTSLITVLNTPLGNVKTLCVTPAPSSNTGQFTVVNSTTSLNIANSASVKPQTITLINTPVTVVKSITAQSINDKNGASNSGSSEISSSLNNLNENRGHNVFVKNTSAPPITAVEDGSSLVPTGTTATVVVPATHKIISTNNFSSNNLIDPKTANGQKNKVKIVSNVLVQPSATISLASTATPLTTVSPTNSTTTTANLLINKTNQRFMPSPAQHQQQQQQPQPRQKLISNNAATAKYINKPLLNKTNVTPQANKNIDKAPTSQQSQQQQQPPPPPLQQQQQQPLQQRVVYSTNKGQIKTIPPMSNTWQKSQGIKTLPPRPVQPGQVQRSGSGLRTIPPQRPQKLPNKPNYIGKHAIQAQKMKSPQKMNKNIKPAMYNNYPVIQSEKQLTFNQALTAEILETLSNNKSSPLSTGPNNNKPFEILPRYDYYNHQDATAATTTTTTTITTSKTHDTVKNCDDVKNKSGLDTLSLICQAVLLDHNYNATLPPESPTRQVPPIQVQAQMNGNVVFSPGSSSKRPRTISQSSSAVLSSSGTTIIPQQSSPQTNVSTSVTNLQSSNTIQQSHHLRNHHEDDVDDAASDISDCSDRKHDTEGEETDTAPEAEAVVNEDQFGDYVTRCICGFVHDDGYMIECDRCKVWQHVQCVVKNKQVPDEYLCEVCDPLKIVDRHKAKLVQQQWLRDRQLMDPKLRKDVKLFNKQPHHHHHNHHHQHNKDVTTDSDSSDVEHFNNNVVTTTKGRPTLLSKRKNNNEHHPTRQQQQRNSSKDLPQRRQIKKREKRVIKRKRQINNKNNQSDDESGNGNAVGGVSSSSSHLPQLRQWIENYEEAVTNHYSPELRARISSIRVNGTHSDLSMQQFDASVHKCRVHTQPLTEIKYLVSTVHLPPNTPIIELRGKYMLSTQHRNSGGNSGSLNTRQHAQRPGPFLFFYRLHKDNTEVCVDTRTYGNSARFIRRSCKPNAELRHCIEKGVLHLYIVTITTVEKNVELTIKHESHDLAAIGTTHISCACGNSEECTVNKSPVKKNGDVENVHRKRRGRRTNTSTLSSSSSSSSTSSLSTTTTTNTTTTAAATTTTTPTTTTKAMITDDVKIKEPEIKKEESDIKNEIKEEIKKEFDSEPPLKNEVKNEIKEEIKKEEDIKDEKDDKESVLHNNMHSNTIITRRSSHKSDKEDQKESHDVKDEKKDVKKMSREERKLEAILRAIAQMEKADQRKQEHQAKQQHRRESEPSLAEKEDRHEPKGKRKKRKGRARATSTTQRRNRLNSTDSYLTSGDETLLSPNEHQGLHHQQQQQQHPINATDNLKDSLDQRTSSKDVGLLLALSNGNNNNNNLSTNSNENCSIHKSPQSCDVDSNSNSAQSSPETHQLSSACLLVQAAVEPMESGLKFPKTKKGLMNEWLNKVPDNVGGMQSSASQSVSGDYDNVSFYHPSGKSLAALAQVASFCDTNLQQQHSQQPQGSAKKRWLRQAMGDQDQCDGNGSGSNSRPESPPLNDTVAPPKKRRLPRTSLSNDNSPPTTPINLTSGGQSNLEYPLTPTENDEPQPQPRSQSATPSIGLMDPRLSRSDHHHHHLFTNSEHLVGTVEKTLSILGFDNAKKPEPITPAKRKLSITEYRQRKKINVDDKNDKSMDEQMNIDDSVSSESFKPLSRQRSDSMSSCTSVTSSDDESGAVVPASTLTGSLEITSKAPAFNSEPTELERQREISNLRLKKAFGIPVNEDENNENAKKPIDVETILKNCEIPIKSIGLRLPNFEVTSTKSSSPTGGGGGEEGTTEDAATPNEKVEKEIVRSSSPVNNNNNSECAPIPSSPGATPPPPPPSSSPPPPPPPLPTDTSEEGKEPMEAEEEELEESVKPNLYYTPDDEEGGETETDDKENNDGDIVGDFEETTVDYVPPFNNPIYPSEVTFTSYTSVIDDEERYEGRNPSPPPDLETNTNFS